MAFDLILMDILFQAAVEISCEPSIGKHVRTHSLDHAAVSTVLLLMEIQQ